MTDYEIVEYRCKRNCELYEKCVKRALKNIDVKCIYFEKVKAQVNAIIEDYKNSPHHLKVSHREIRALLRRTR